MDILLNGNSDGDYFVVVKTAKDGETCCHAICSSMSSDGCCVYCTAATMMRSPEQHRDLYHSSYLDPPRH